MVKGIYLHIPFCRKKCAYCDFASRDSWSRDFLEAYLDALLADLKASLPSWE